MAKVIENLERDLQSLVHASSDARKASTEGEAKAEHKYDTRGIEQGYLANGQAKRGFELQESISILRSLPLLVFSDSSEIQISALVDLENEDGECQSFFILPLRGGMKIQSEEKEVLTLSPDSPMGAMILSKTIGDTIEVKLKSRTVNYIVRSIR
ncbi:MAG: GreA/GreB family elongation factor [Deltaproteobacteria bacterium]|nr:GreA/GreB family elongation factor [Deltaproteobacteria bacterium]